MPRSSNAMCLRTSAVFMSAHLLEHARERAKIARGGAAFDDFGLAHSGAELRVAGPFDEIDIKLARPRREPLGPVVGPGEGLECRPVERLREEDCVDVAVPP